MPMQDSVKGLTLVLCAILLAPAGGAPLEGFEGPQPSWRRAGGDARCQILDHRRVHDGAHQGPGYEQIRLLANNGSAIYFAHPVPPARVIDELTPSVSVSSDRPGIEMLVRVALPRTRDTRDGRPLTTLIRGPQTTGKGGWQRLRLQGLPRLLAQQVPALRSQFGPQVDPREAYVDQVVLNVYTGSGPTTVWIDDPVLAGRVPPGSDAEPRRSDPAPPIDGPAQRLPPTGATTDDQSPQQVRLEGMVLMIGSRPTLPRVIQYQGEPLAFLERLGFNVVGMATPPSPALLAEANRLGLWLVCPPPAISQLDRSAVGEGGEPVLAWDMGSGLDGSQLNDIAHWARALSRSARLPRCPLLGSCATDQRAYSRILSILVANRAPLGTSLELSDYARWLADQPRLALPGTPIWVRIQTQPLPGLVEQLAALSTGVVPQTGIDYGQIRLLSGIALSAGARGLIYESLSPLNAPDAVTRQRAQALELVNLQLDLIEPWVASAGVATTVTSSDPLVTGTLLHSQAERARLLIPIYWQDGGQFVSGPSASEDLSFVVPGVPEANRVYELTLGGLRSLRHQRVAGGIRVWLEQLDASTVVVMTQDPLVISSLQQRVRQTGRRASDLLQTLAAGRLELVEQVQQRLTSGAGGAPARDAVLSARASLRQSGLLHAGGDCARAYDAARRAMHALGQAQRSHFEYVLRGSGSPVASPLTAGYPTLPEQIQFADRLRTSRLGPNQLIGGDFEDLAVLQRSGWQHHQHPVAGLRTTVELTPRQPHSGRFSLQLRAAAVDAQTAPPLVATPPVWVTSPPVSVPAGQLLRIHGWVRVTQLQTGQVGSLMVIDSLGGEALAARVGPSSDWRELTLYRVAPQATSATVTFALSGYGQAEVDGVTIAAVDLPYGNVPAPKSTARGPWRIPSVR